MEEKVDWLINVVDGGIQNVAQAQTSGYDFELLNPEDYWKLDNVKKKFNNDEELFDKTYKQARKAYEVYQDLEMLPNVTYKSAALDTPFTRSLGVAVDTEPIKMDRVLNPYRESSGFVGINKKGEKKESILEIAQQQGFYKDESGKKIEQDIEGFGFFKADGPLVLATYDEKGTHIDPLTGEKSEHLKGDLKIDEETLEPFYEKLAGRDITDKKVLQFADAITPEKHWSNTLNVFEADEVRTSPIKSIIKTGLKIAPMFIPYVGQAYALSYGLTNLADAGLEAYKSLDAIINDTDRDDQVLANEMQGWLKQFSNDSTTEESQANMFTTENFGNLLYNIVGEVTSQAAIATLPQKLAALTSGKVGAKKLSEVFKTPLQDISSLADDMGAENFKKYSAISRGAALAYNTLIGSKDVADIADLSGLTNREGAFMQLGVGAVLSSLYRFSPYEQWIERGLGLGPQTTINKKLLKETAEDLADKTGLTLKSPEGKLKFLKKYKDKLNEVLNDPTASSAIANASISEALEEETELAVNLGAKAMYNTLQGLGYTEQDKNKFKLDPSEIAQEAVMVGVAGAMGGSLFRILSKTPEFTDPSLNELVATVGPEKLIKATQDLHRAKALPARYDVTIDKDKDGNYKLKKEGESSHADILAGLTIAQIQKTAENMESQGVDQFNLNKIKETFNRDVEEYINKIDEVGLTIDLNGDTPFVSEAINIFNELETLQTKINNSQDSPLLPKLQKDYDNKKKELDEIVKISEGISSEKAVDFYKQGLVTRLTSLHEKIGIKTRNTFAKEKFKKNYWELEESEQKAVQESWENYKSSQLKEDVKNTYKKLDEIDEDPLFKQLQSLSKNEGEKKRILDNAYYKDFINTVSSVIKSQSVGGVAKEAAIVAFLDDLLKNPYDHSYLLNLKEDTEENKNGNEIIIDYYRDKLTELKEGLFDNLISGVDYADEVEATKDSSFKELYEDYDLDPQGDLVKKLAVTLSGIVSKNNFVLDESDLEVIDNSLSDYLKNNTTLLGSAVPIVNNKIGLFKNDKDNFRLGSLLGKAASDISSKYKKLEELRTTPNIQDFFNQNIKTDKTTDEDFEFIEKTKKELDKITKNYDLPRFKVDKKYDNLLKREFKQFFSDPNNYVDNSEGSVKENNIKKHIKDLDLLEGFMEMKSYVNSALNGYIEQSKLVPEEFKEKKYPTITDNPKTNYRTLATLSSSLSAYKHKLQFLHDKLVDNRKNQLKNIQKISIKLAKAQINVLTDIAGDYADLSAEQSRIQAIDENDASPANKAKAYKELASAAEEFKKAYNRDEEFKNKVNEIVSKRKFSLSKDNSELTALTGEAKLNFIASILRYDLENTFTQLNSYLKETDNYAPLANQIDNLIQLNSFINRKKYNPFKPAKDNRAVLSDFIFVTQPPGYGKTEMLAKTLVGMNDKKTMYFAGNETNVEKLKKGLDFDTVDHNNSGKLDVLLKHINADLNNQYLGKETTASFIDSDGKLKTTVLYKPETGSFKPSVSKAFNETELIIIDEATHLTNGQMEAIQKAVSAVNEKRREKGAPFLKVVALGDNNQLGAVKDGMRSGFNQANTIVESTTRYELSIRSGNSYIPDIINQFEEIKSRPEGQDNSSFEKAPARINYEYWDKDGVYLGLQFSDNGSDFKTKADDVYRQYTEELKSNPEANIVFVTSDPNRINEVLTDSEGVIVKAPSNVQSGEYDYVILDDITTFDDETFSISSNLDSLNTFISRGKKRVLLKKEEAFKDIEFISEEHKGDEPKTNVTFTPEILEDIKKSELEALQSFTAKVSETQQEPDPKEELESKSKTEVQEPKVEGDDFTGYYKIYEDTFGKQGPVSKSPYAYTLFLAKGAIENTPLNVKKPFENKKEFAKLHLQMMNSIIKGDSVAFKELTGKDLNNTKFTIETSERKGDFEIQEHTNNSIVANNVTMIVMDNDGKKVPLFVLANTDEGYFGQLYKENKVHGEISAESIKNAVKSMHITINKNADSFTPLTNIMSDNNYFSYSKPFVLTANIDNYKEGNAFVLVSSSDKIKDKPIDSLTTKDVAELLKEKSLSQDDTYNVIYVVGKEYNSLQELVGAFKTANTTFRGNKEDNAAFLRSFVVEEHLKNYAIKLSKVDPGFAKAYDSNDAILTFFNYLEKYEEKDLNTLQGLIERDGAPFKIRANISILYEGKQDQQVAETVAKTRDLYATGVDGIRMPNVWMEENKIKDNLKLIAEQEESDFEKHKAKFRTIYYKNRVLDKVNEEALTKIFTTAKSKDDFNEKIRGLEGKKVVTLTNENLVQSKVAIKSKEGIPVITLEETPVDTQTMEEIFGEEGLEYTEYKDNFVYAIDENNIDKEFTISENEKGELKGQCNVPSATKKGETPSVNENQDTEGYGDDIGL